MKNKYFCRKCLSSGYLQAFSTGKCIYCGESTITPHIPAYRVCVECSDKYRVCQQCGDVLP
jgi:hypothetical protein